MSLLQTVFVVHSFRSTKLGVLLAGILLATMSTKQRRDYQCQKPCASRRGFSRRFSFDR